MAQEAAGVAGDDLLKTPLYDLHLSCGAKIVPFAGYAMPVQYPLGVMKEHLHTRASAGLFDVSHMGQARLTGPDHATVAAALEALTPGLFLKLGQGTMRYTLLLNDAGGIIDDLMVTNLNSSADRGELFLVVNAARKSVDYAYLRAQLPSNVELEPLEDRALLALQGPRAAEVMARHCPQAAELLFMKSAVLPFDGIDCMISRSGYTGEDGFEISVPASAAPAVFETLVAAPEVEPVGLGARDSLRLEAGLCLYGQDIDEQTSPIEAALDWAVGKRRRLEGGFAGADRILRELAEGPGQLRVGLRPEGRAPAREGTDILGQDGQPIGEVTSGGYGPTVQGPVAMGYVDAGSATLGTKVVLMVRDRPHPATVAQLPFVPQRYVRKT